MKELTHVKFHQHLKKAREESGMSQAQLSALTGIPQPQLSRIECGKTSMENGVTLGIFTKLANKLKVSADSLLKG